MTDKLRYPGLRPFDPGENNHFFGREKEIKEICRMLDLDSLLILHGASGTGKSSILNAGVLPSLKEIRKWEIDHFKIPVRFANYDPEATKTRLSDENHNASEAPLQSKDPIDSFIDACPDKHHFWQNLIPLPTPNLWLTVKDMEWRALGEPLRWVFILDQFEELFTYPEERVIEFAKQLGELYHQTLPESVRRGIERKLIIDGEESFRNAIGQENHPNNYSLEEALNWLREEPLDVKILISMRSDKLNHLERIRPFIPNIMMNSYELRSLDTNQAKKAILGPAELADGTFDSPQFSYNSDVIEDIISFLQDKLTRRIEPAQLQIICGDIEQRMIKKERRIKQKK